MKKAYLRGTPRQDTLSQLSQHNITLQLCLQYDFVWPFISATTLHSAMYNKVMANMYNVFLRLLSATKRIRDSRCIFSMKGRLSHKCQMNTHQKQNTNAQTRQDSCEGKNSRPSQHLTTTNDGSINRK